MALLWWDFPPVSTSIFRSASRPNLSQVRLRDAPLAGDALVNQRLSVGREGSDLGFDATTEIVVLQIMLLDSANNLALHFDLWKRDADKAEVTVAKPLSRRAGEG
jgi:hypothetical protein